MSKSVEWAKDAAIIAAGAAYYATSISYIFSKLAASYTMNVM